MLWCSLAFPFPVTTTAVVFNLTDRPIGSKHPPQTFNILIY